MSLLTGCISYSSLCDGECGFVWGQAWTLLLCELLYKLAKGVADLTSTTCIILFSALPFLRERRVQQAWAITCPTTVYFFV